MLMKYSSVPPVSFEHLLALSDGVGLFEHAEYTEPRRELGYCVDDVARGLLVIARAPAVSERLSRQARIYLSFVIDAQTDDGAFHNRCAADRIWQDAATLDDCWGRALWGLGTAAARIPESTTTALRHFELGATRRSPHVRATAFAALGAAEILRIRPDHVRARALLTNAVKVIGSPASGRDWFWPEPRLRYANAVLAEVLLAAGSLLGDTQALADGIGMLTWLLRTETIDNHLSVTPVDGWALGESRPGFDQQPIEVAALADACARAFEITDSRQWRTAVLHSAAWFLGENDANLALYDPITGGGYDGLERTGRNENQGAESTLAMISTFQQAHRIGALPR